MGRGSLTLGRGRGGAYAAGTPGAVAVTGALDEGPPPTSHRLRCADGRALPGVDPEGVDLVVTSPPYPMIRMWDEVFSRADPEVGRSLREGRGLDAFERMHRLLDGTWTACARALRPGGFLCVNVGDATRTLGGRFALYPNHARVLSAVQSLGLTPLPTILWWKPTNAPNKFLGAGMLPAGGYVTLEHEFVLIFRKEPPRRFRTTEAREQRRRSAFFWEERNRWFSDTWDLKGAPQGAPGPLRTGAFPLELPYRLISMFSLVGDHVLDPFAGTGTTLRAAMGLARHSVGFEISEAVCRTARARLGAPPRELNERNRQRLAEHLALVDAPLPGRRSLRHRHRGYGFPVTTGQECALTLWEVSTIEPAGPEGWTVAYRSMPGAQGAPKSGAMQGEGFEPTNSYETRP